MFYGLQPELHRDTENACSTSTASLLLPDVTRTEEINEVAAPSSCVPNSFEAGTLRTAHELITGYCLSNDYRQQ